MECAYNHFENYNAIELKKCTLAKVQLPLFRTVIWYSHNISLDDIQFNSPFPSVIESNCIPFNFNRLTDYRFGLWRKLVKGNKQELYHRWWNKYVILKPVHCWRTRYSWFTKAKCMGILSMESPLQSMQNARQNGTWPTIKYQIISSSYQISDIFDFKLIFLNQPNGPAKTNTFFFVFVKSAFLLS